MKCIVEIKIDDVSGMAGTDPGGWMGWLAIHHEWPCNYSDMQIKALHY